MEQRGVPQDQLGSANPNSSDAQGVPVPPGLLFQLWRAETRQRAIQTISSVKVAFWEGETKLSSPFGSPGSCLQNDL